MNIEQQEMNRLGPKQHEEQQRKRGVITKRVVIRTYSLSPMGYRQQPWGSTWVDWQCSICDQTFEANEERGPPSRCPYEHQHGDYHYSPDEDEWPYLLKKEEERIAAIKKKQEEE